MGNDEVSVLNGSLLTHLRCRSSHRKPQGSANHA